MRFSGEVLFGHTIPLGYTERVLRVNSAASSSVTGCSLYRARSYRRAASPERVSRAVRLSCQSG